MCHYSKYHHLAAGPCPAHNQPVHLIPKARAFFTLAVSEQNVAFAKSSLAFGAGDWEHPQFLTKTNFICIYGYF
jgi:hypothetical protein